MPRSACLAFLTALSLWGAPEAVAQGPLNKQYRDSVHKFSLKVFREWDQVPVRVGEQFVVAQWMDPGGQTQAPSPQLMVVRVKKQAATTGGEEKPAKAEEKGPASVRELVNKRFGYPPAPAEGEVREIESRDDVPGELWALETGGYFRTLATFGDPNVEYGLLMVCAKSRRKNYEKGFAAIARSFTFRDKKAEDVGTLKVLEGVNLEPERRAAIEAGLVKGWDVMVSPKKNYVVIYNTKGNENKLLAKTIAYRIEAIREQIYEEQFPPTREFDDVSIVRVCGDKGEYIAYGGNPRSAGYWNYRSEELVFYDASRSRKVSDDTIAVLYHEAFHQYIFYSVGQVSPHSWFNEGHGDYYAGARYRGRRFKIEPFDWRVQVVKTAVRKGPVGGYVPLNKLIAYTQREYYSNASVCYAQGWSLVYFLREVAARKSSTRKKWGHILETYFDVLKEEVVAAREAAEAEKEGGEAEGEEGQEGERPETMTKNGEDPLQKALDAAFEGVDIQELEEAWVRFVNKL